MKKILPLLNKDSIHSVLEGDYILVGNYDKEKYRLYNQKLLEVLFDELELPNYFGITHMDQIHLVYINNISKKGISDIKLGLSEFDELLGIINVTYSSLFKTYISTILVKSFLKCNKYILMGHQDDVEDDKTNENTKGYPFEDFDYQIRSIQSMYYHLFLSYKIERNEFKSKEYHDDIYYSICALTENTLKMNDLFIKVSDDKLGYIKENKKDIMKKLDLLHFSPENLEEIIKEKIQGNYIYNLRFIDNDKYNAYLFNVMLEINTLHESEIKKHKVLVALKYLYDKKQLFVTTMY